MDDWTLVKLSFRTGVWQGRLTAPAHAGTLPEFEVQTGGATIAGVELSPDGAGGWMLSVPVPVEVLGDGIVSFLVVEKSTGSTRAQFSIATGEPAEDDLRAEVALLRAELDMLKRHFRRRARAE